MRKSQFPQPGISGRLLISFFLVFLFSGSSFSQKRAFSVELENLNWIEAEKTLREYDVVLVALGARTKEHGPHLPLNTDYIMAEYFKTRISKEVPVVVLPTIQYGYYPSFLEYPGSVSIQAGTFKSTVADICR